MRTDRCGGLPSPSMASIQAFKFGRHCGPGTPNKNGLTFRARSHGHSARSRGRPLIANVFESVNREQALASAETLDPLLAQALVPWLSRPSLASLRTDAERKTILATGTGIPQRDPLSSVFFLHRSSPGAEGSQWSSSVARTHTCSSGRWSLATTISVAGAALLRLISCLRDLELELNTTKTTAWGPSLTTLPPSLLTMLSPNTLRTDGILICGLPISASESPQTDDDLAIPLGTSTFENALLQSDFLCRTSGASFDGLDGSAKSADAPKTI